MNNKVFLSRRIANVAIVFGAVLVLIATMALTSPYLAHADDNGDSSVDLTESAVVSTEPESANDANPVDPEPAPEQNVPVDEIVPPKPDDGEPLLPEGIIDGADSVLGENRAPNGPGEGESRQARPNRTNTWTEEVENGQLKTTIGPENRRNIAPVLMERTFKEAAVISGPFKAKVQSQNGYDVTNGHGQTELRFVGPDGREFRNSVVVDVDESHISAVDTRNGNGWGGIRFDIPGEIAVPAGSKIEVSMWFHGRQKHRRQRENRNIQSPLGPGALDMRDMKMESSFRHRNQQLFVCGQLIDQNAITGFKIYPTKPNFEGKIKEIRAAGVVENGSLNQIHNEMRSSIDGLNSNSAFTTRVTTTGNAMCIQIIIDANERVNTGAVHNHLGISFQHEFFPEAANEAFTNIVSNPFDNWDTPSQRNPKHSTNRCGLNIAIVLDASNSVMIENGVTNFSNSAHKLVEKLEGTGSSVGIYNFASHGPRDTPGFRSATVDSQPLSSEAGIANVKTAINNYETSMNPELLLGTTNHDGTGSTNWEAGLKQIQEYNNKNKNKIYDVVYFITDGLPTLSDADRPAGGEKGSGGIVHVSDVSRARDVADAIKRQGSLIQPILVNLPEDTQQPVAKDSTVTRKNAKEYYQAHGKVPGHVLDIWDRGNSTANRHSDVNLAVELESQNVDVFRGGRQIWRGFGMGDARAASLTPQPLPDFSSRGFVQRDAETWAAGQRTPKQLGNAIGDNNAVVASTLNEIENLLSDLALASCAGTVTLTKELIDSNGATIEDADLQGWEFLAYTPEGEFLREGKNRTFRTKGTTGTDGHVNFQIETDRADQHVDVDLTEIQKPGFELARLGNSENDPFAHCSVQELETGSKSLLPVENLENGFKIQATSGQIVTCRVVNRKLPDEMGFMIEKLDYETQKPIEGAKFQVFAADGQGRPDWERGVIWETDKQSAQRLNPGEYYLVETQAPQGYSLLPQPVYFELSQNERGTYISGAAPFIVSSRIESKEVDGQTVHTAVMQLANVLKGDLPLTGGRGIWGFALAGLLLLVVAAFYTKKTGRRV